MYDHTARRPDGRFVRFGPGPTGWEVVERDMLQCVHCGYFWVVEPGSGKRRGWCQHCSGPHCGAEACYTCLPLKKKIDQACEASRFADYAGLQR